MQVQTKYGMVEGKNRDTYIEYLGIPYAKPPVGALRWRPPQPPKPWEGIREATAFGNKCMQEEMDDPLYIKEFYSDSRYRRTSSEDCLYLHIWAPKEAKGRKLPVAFWIHGGAFMGGFASEMEFDGAGYCKRDVILVSVEYRCNIFGFYAHPWLSKEDPKCRSGNYGILDQIAALTWVYENIEAFGGDPENITVFGQSAGAMSAQTLVSSELTGNMIAKAIFQSGGSYREGLHRDIPQEEEERLGTILTDMLGVQSLEELRAIPAEELQGYMRAYISRVIQEFGGLFLTPVIDGHVLKEGYNSIVEQGKLKRIPYLVGSLKDDILAPLDSGDDKEKKPLYQGCRQLSLKLEEILGKAAYVYYFSRELPGDGAGAFHSAELWYTFGTLDRCWRPMTEHDYALSSRMLDYWTNFMKNGTPNGQGHPWWRPCSKEDPFVMELC